MNGLSANYDCVPKLGESLKSNRKKWRKIQDCKVWFTTLQLSIATVLRAGNLSLEFFGYFMMGATVMAGAVAEHLDSQETHYYYVDSGRYAGKEKDCETCAFLWYLITISCFLLGCGSILASVMLWLLAYMFVGLSFLWCFRTDLQFEEETAEAIAELKAKIEQTQDSKPERLEEAYVKAFEENKATKLEKLNANLAGLIERTDAERQKRESRSGKASPTRSDASPTSGEYVPAAAEVVGAEPTTQVEVFEVVVAGEESV
jgi:hypothetical protein